MKTAGKSYLGFPCAACKAPIKALTVHADEPIPRLPLIGEIRLPCPSCGHEDSYALGRLSRYEEFQMH